MDVYAIRVARRRAESAFLERLDTALRGAGVRITDDARETAFIQFGWGISDIHAVLHVLDEGDYSHAEPSTAVEGGTIWVFLHMTDEGRLWIRICERGHLVVVSFHRG